MLQILQILLALAAAAIIAGPVLAFTANQVRNGRGIAWRDRLAFINLASDVGAVTLAEAQVNCQDDVEFAVIDELRRKSWLLDQLTFDDCVNPSGGGSTLTYGYTRLVQAAGAAFRDFNAEYTPGKATRQRYTVDLKPLGGAFEIDRVLANLGQAATNEEAFQLDQTTKAVKTGFQKALIQGDTDSDSNEVNGFDGLDAALRESSTEVSPTTVIDWTASTVNTEALAHGALDTLDDFLSILDGTPDAILGNRQSITRVRAIGRRAGYYSRSRDDLGRVVEKYGDSVLVDVGDDNSGSAIIPVRSIDADNTKYTTQVTGTPTGGSFSLNITVDGTTVETDAIAFDATNAVYKSTIEANSNVPANSVVVTGTTTKTIEFKGKLSRVVVTVALADNNLTGGSSPSVTVTEASVTTDTAGVTDLYAVRFGLDAFHGVSTVGQLLKVWRPDYSTAGAVKKGEVEMGPVAAVLKATKAAAVLRNIKVQ